MASCGEEKLSTWHVGDEQKCGMLQMKKNMAIKITDEEENWHIANEEKCGTLQTKTEMACYG